MTDDIEPTSLTECGDVKLNDTRCGGWGFTSLNYLRAAIWAGLRNHSYAGQQEFSVLSPSASTESTPKQPGGPCVLAVVTPDDESTFAADTTTIQITWRTLLSAAAAVKYTVQIDGQPRDCAVHYHQENGDMSCVVKSSDLKSGTHVLTVTADGGWTRLGVGRDRFDPYVMGERVLTPNASVHVHFGRVSEVVMAKPAPQGHGKAHKTDDLFTQEALGISRAQMGLALFDEAVWVWR